MHDRIVALILAAGYSSRMGEFKPLLNFDGKPVIEWAISSFRKAGITDIRVVVGYQADKLFPVLHQLKVSPILNENYEMGMFSSIQAGLRSFATEADAFFLLPGDIPLIKKRTLEKMLKIFYQNKYDVILPAFLSRPGHPPLISGNCFNRILNHDITGNLRSILQEYKDKTCQVEVADQGILMDMDTLEDYQNLLQYRLQNKTPALDEYPSIIAHHIR